MRIRLSYLPHARMRPSDCSTLENTTGISQFRWRGRESIHLESHVARRCFLAIEAFPRRLAPSHADRRVLRRLRIVAVREAWVPLRTDTTLSAAESQDVKES